MNYVRLARVAKIAALICFLLPWITVSCSSGQRLGSVSGFDMTIGQMVVHNPMTGGTQTSQIAPNLLVILAVMAIAAGLTLSFTAVVDAALRRMMMTSIAALALTVLGAETTIGVIQAKIHSSDNNGVAGFAASMFKVSLSSGFYIVLALLATTAISCLLGSMASPVGTTSHPLKLNQNRLRTNIVTGDIVFWDSMSSKSDPDLLEEYLARYPRGNFAALARKRLGVSNPEAPIALESNELSVRKQSGPTLQSRSPLFDYGIVAVLLIALLIGVLIYSRATISPGEVNASPQKQAAEAAVSADAAAADAARATTDAAQAVTQSSPNPAMDAASQQAAAAANAPSINDAAASAADAQISAERARAAAADAATRQSSFRGPATNYICAFASDISKQPIANATDMTFMIDEERSCINGRSPYLRSPNGTLTKLMLNDQEHRASMLQMSADRTIFSRFDAALTPEAYERLHSQARALSKIPCPPLGDLQALSSVQQSLTDLTPRTAITPAGVVERHMTRWRCVPQ